MKLPNTNQTYHTLQDYSDPYQLLAPSNRDTEAMYNYARQAADWSTKLPRLDFAVSTVPQSLHSSFFLPQLNHKGIPDVDLFDLTSIYQAEYSCRAVRRNGKDLFICLVGDTLLHVRISVVSLVSCDGVYTAAILARRHWTGQRLPQCNGHSVASTSDGTKNTRAESH